MPTKCSQRNALSRGVNVLKFFQNLAVTNIPNGKSSKNQQHLLSHIHFKKLSIIVTSANKFCRPQWDSQFIKSSYYKAENLSVHKRKAKKTTLSNIYCMNKFSCTFSTHQMAICTSKLNSSPINFELDEHDAEKFEDEQITGRYMGGQKLWLNWIAI